MYFSSPSGSLSNSSAKKARASTGSSVGVYVFRPGMQTKQEPVDSYNFLNGTVLIIVMFVSVSQLNATCYLSKR